MYVGITHVNFPILFTQLSIARADMRSESCLTSASQDSRDTEVDITPSSLFTVSWEIRCKIQTTMSIVPRIYIIHDTMYSIHDCTT